MPPQTLVDLHASSKILTVGHTHQCVFCASHAWAGPRLDVVLSSSPPLATRRPGTCCIGGQCLPACVWCRAAAQSLIRGTDGDVSLGWDMPAHRSAAVLCFDEMQVTDPFAAVALKGPPHHSCHLASYLITSYYLVRNEEGGRGGLVMCT